MPECMSIERRNLLKAYGAEIVLTPAWDGMKGAIDKSVELWKEIKWAFLPQQFENTVKPMAHYKTTGQEIWEKTGWNVDVFIASVGNGWTISVIWKFLKEKNKDIKIIAVEPKDSAVLSGGKKWPHKIQGIGAGFIPKILNTKIYDEIFQVSDEDALETARLLAKEEGLFCGISSGANVYAALEIAKRAENKGKCVVVILCDTGERYLSTTLFNQEKDAIWFKNSKYFK